MTTRMGKLLFRFLYFGSTQISETRPEGNHNHDCDHDPILLYRDAEELPLDGGNSDKEGNQARGFDVLDELLVVGEKEDGMPCILREVYFLKDGVALTDNYNYPKPPLDYTPPPLKPGEPPFDMVDNPVSWGRYWLL
eukprot:jgi/Psemu1/22808/gm1.22808_g